MLFENNFMKNYSRNHKQFSFNLCNFNQSNFNQLKLCKNFNKKIAAKGISSVCILSFCICLSFLPFVSCSSTLQEDKLNSTELSAEILNSISDFEKTFIELDVEFFNSGKINSGKASELHSSLEEKIHDSYEPAVLARLQALNSLLYFMENKTKKADSFYKEAKGNQPKDSYVLIIESRLEKNTIDSLSKIEGFLNTDSKNGLLLLEKAKLLYKLKQFDNSIAAFDSAFLIFDNNSNVPYRENYNEIRASAWAIYSAGISNESTLLQGNDSSKDLTKALTKETMLQITVEESPYLSKISSTTTNTKNAQTELIKKVVAKGYFSSSIDANNEKKSSDTVLNSNAITRIIAARFLWNLYVENKEKPELLTRYSSRYSKKANATSPIPDVQINNQDFDAALGLVENEIINLKDGTNFYPDEVITGIEYLGYLKNMQK